MACPLAAPFTPLIRTHIQHLQTAADICRATANQLDPIRETTMDETPATENMPPAAQKPGLDAKTSQTRSPASNGPLAENPRRELDAYFNAKMADPDFKRGPQAKACRCRPNVLIRVDADMWINAFDVRRIASAGDNRAHVWLHGDIEPIRVKRTPQQVRDAVKEATW